MNSSDSEDQVYFSNPYMPFECPFCQEAREYRQMPPPGRPPQGGGGNMPPQGPPPQGGGGNMPPMGPPPSINSQHHGQPQVKAVDPGAIRPCTYRYVYIYPRRGKAYWAWLTNVGRRSASGYKWTGHNWVYFGIDLKEIQSFDCY